jgi:hypothetical protein
MFALDQVVPWGRSLAEYRRMFALSDADLELRILGCADGPASFNAESTQRGTAVISIDPLYRLDSTRIRDRIAATYGEMLEQAKRNSQQFAWDTIQSVEELGQIRMQAMQAFWTITILESTKAVTLTLNSDPSPSRTNHLTWRFARIFSFCTRSTFAPREELRIEGSLMDIFIYKKTATCLLRATNPCESATGL